MHHDGIGTIFIVFFLPYLHKERLGADDPAEVFAQDAQNFKFCRRQGQRALVECTGMACNIHCKSPDAEQLRLRL